MDQEKTPAYGGEGAQDGFLAEDVGKYPDSPGHTALAQDTATTNSRFGAEIRESNVPIREACSDYPDGGLRAWLVVLGCVLFSANTLGWALGWGVVQDYYKSHVFPQTSTTTLSTLGSMSTWIMTLLSLFTGKLGDRYGYMPFLSIGALFWIGGMLGSVFSTHLWQFFITQGILQGIANALIFPIIVALPAQWFRKKRAFAIGVVVGGCSLGGAIATLIMYKTFASLGLKKTYAIYTGIDAASFLAALLLIKERRLPSQRKKIIWFDSRFFSDPVFWSLGLCILCTVFGYLSPVFFLPAYTKDVRPSTSGFLSALPLVLLNFGAAAGRISIGFIADRIGPVNALLISTLFSGLSQLLIWNFVTTYAGILAFGIIYGFFCGCFISLTPAVCAQLWGADRLAGLSGLTLLFNLPGNAAGAPLGSAILNGSGGNWHAVACYSGGIQIVGVVLMLYARFKKERRVFAAY